MRYILYNNFLERQADLKPGDYFRAWVGWMVATIDAHHGKVFFHYLEQPGLYRLGRNDACDD